MIASVISSIVCSPCFDTASCARWRSAFLRDRSSCSRAFCRASLYLSPSPGWLENFYRLRATIFVKLVRVDLRHHHDARELGRSRGAHYQRDDELFLRSELRVTRRIKYAEEEVRAVDVLSIPKNLCEYPTRRIHEPHRIICGIGESVEKGGFVIQPGSESRWKKRPVFGSYIRARR